MIVDAKGATKTNYKTRNVSIPDIETFDCELEFM